MLDGIQNHYEAWQNRIEALHLGKICEKKKFCENTVDVATATTYHLGQGT